MEFKLDQKEQATFSLREISRDISDLLVVISEIEVCAVSNNDQRIVNLLIGYRSFLENIYSKYEISIPSLSKLERLFNIGVERFHYEKK
jgi:hypothetical protein